MDNEKGVENNIKYDVEFLKLNFTHLALVNNPRYDRANIVLNSKSVDNDKWITIKPNGEDAKGRHLLLKDGETPKEAIERQYGDFEKQSKSTKKDEDRHQKILDLEDKAYKEFKTIYDNYIDKDGIAGWGSIPVSRFDKAKEQFNKKYKDAFEKLKSDRFVSFEDFAKRENNSDKKEQTFNKLIEEYKDYFNDKQLKEFKEELKTFDKYKGLENIDLETSKKSFSEMKPEDALKTLKSTNNLYKRWEKEDILKEKFDNYVKKLDIKDNRLSELRRFIGSYQDYFTGKIPTFEEFRDDIRYNFDTDLALKYLADDKGFEHFDNISDREMAKVKSGYDKFLKILDVNNTKEEDMHIENTEFRTGYDSDGEAYVYPLEGADDKEDKKKETRKEDKKDSGYKIPDDYKKSVKDYTKEQHEKAVDEYGEKMAKAAKKANAGIGKDDGGNQYKTYSAQFDEYKALKDYHEQQATKSEDKKEDKKQPKQLKLFNSKERTMEIIDKLKALIFSVENEKEYEMEITNEKVDKRKLIDEVAGIMKSAGCDDEDIRTAIGKMEKIGYDGSEASDVDNKKKVKNEETEEDKKEVKEVEEEVKEDVDNKCKNSVDNAKVDYFSKLDAIYNSGNQAKESVGYMSRADREQAADDYFRN